MRKYILPVVVCLLASRLEAEVALSGTWLLQPYVVIEMEWSRLYLDEQYQSGGVHRIDFLNNSKAVLYWRKEPYSSRYTVIQRKDDYTQIHFKLSNNMIHFYLTVTVVEDEYLYIYSIDQRNGLSEHSSKKPFFCEFIGVMNREPAK